MESNRPIMTLLLTGKDAGAIVTVLLAVLRVMLKQRLQAA